MRDPRALHRPRSAAVVLAAALALAACGTPAGDAGTSRATTDSIDALELDALTIPVIQERIDAGELSSVELTQAYLDRIAEVDGELGAVLSVNPDALDAAAASDEERKRHGARSPLEGVPVLLKDNVDTADQPTTAGSRALVSSRPDDATITAKLREAGAVIIGKANLSEWANFRGFDSTSGWSGVGGQTANPYVLDRNPCGSSSGSASGVAASLAQVSIGTETDGSIVCPAGSTGIVGVKPTLGLVSRTGIVPISAEQDTAGPMARHAVDAALLLEVVSGVDESDAATTLAPADLVSDFSDLDTSALTGARIGVWTLSPDEQAAVDDGTEAVYAAAVAQIEAAGATAVPLTIAYTEEVGAGETPALLAEFRRDLTAYLAETPGDAPDDLAGVVAFDDADPVELAYFDDELFEQAITAPDATAVREEIRTLARRSIDEALAQGPGTEDDLDAVVGLTNTPSWLTRYQSVDGVADDFVYSTSSPAAVAGYPSIAVPAGFAGPREALPIGITIFGAQWADADLLDLAASFEQASGARRAPGFLPTVGD